MDDYVDKRPHYRGDIGPNGENWDNEKIANEVWTRLERARTLMDAGGTNAHLVWIKPGPLNPECGVRVFLPRNGLLRRRREFAQIVLTVIGKHFRISSWRAKRGGRTIFDTEDSAYSDDFFANLDAAADRLTEIVVQVDRWIRSGTINQAFPKEWVGMTRWQVTKSLIEQYLRNDRERTNLP